MCYNIVKCSMKGRWIVVEKIIPTAEEKKKFINALLKDLPLLRAKSGASQEEIAGVIGITRQSYGAIERKVRPLTWNTYLALILFFDYNAKTHNLLHTLSAFPHELIRRFNGNENGEKIDLGELFNDGGKNLLSELDEQAKNSIKTMIMIEYARCTKLPGKEVVKFFDGMEFSVSEKSEKNIAASKALKNIKEQNERR